jgi:hypothetical protein
MTGDNQPRKPDTPPPPPKQASSKDRVSLVRSNKRGSSEKAPDVKQSGSEVAKRANQGERGLSGDVAKHPNSGSQSKVERMRGGLNKAAEHAKGALKRVEMPVRAAVTGAAITAVGVSGATAQLSSVDKPAAPRDNGALTANVNHARLSDKYAVAARAEDSSVPGQNPDKPSPVKAVASVGEAIKARKKDEIDAKAREVKTDAHLKGQSDADRRGQQYPT